MKRSEEGREGGREEGSEGGREEKGKMEKIYQREREGGRRIYWSLSISERKRAKILNVCMYIVHCVHCVVFLFSVRIQSVLESISNGKELIDMTRLANILKQRILKILNQVRPHPFNQASVLSACTYKYKIYYNPRGLKIWEDT